MVRVPLDNCAICISTGNAIDQWDSDPDDDTPTF